LFDRKSHKRMVRSKEPDMKLSSTGDICSETTLNANKQKYIYINIYIRYSKLQSIRIGFSDIWETEFLTAYFGPIVTHLISR